MVPKSKDSWFSDPAHRTGHIPGTAGRYFIAIPVLFYSFEQFRHGNYAPAIPLSLVTPHWIFGYAVWTYLTAAVFAIAGAPLLVGKKAREEGCPGRCAMPKKALGVCPQTCLLWVCLPRPSETGKVVGASFVGSVISLFQGVGASWGILNSRDGWVSAYPFALVQQRENQSRRIPR